jgi:2-polyprenyl-6-methoxyphenol hydroxylase-like FAD-dependent oxidoreductase
MAGLVAARVLADHFDRVTLVDRDRLPSDASSRPGVPQGSHVHILLMRGKLILEELFPGFQDELVAAGAPLVDGARDFAWLTPYGWGVRYPSGRIGVGCSRGLREATVRRRVAQNPRITFVEERTATGLVASEDRTRILGARLGPRNLDASGGGPTETVVADLVVDATGRGSKAARWLQDLGYPAPAETIVNPFLGYASRLYRVPDDPARDWKGTYDQGGADNPRGGLLLPYENGRSIVTLGGVAKDYPPSGEDGFLAFARSLRSPLIYDAIKDAEPLTPITATRSTANVWRRYERLPRWPDRFVALGDAVCAFNPVYGQGMTVAAMEAMVLDKLLRVHRQRRPDGDLTGLAGRFQQSLPKTISPVWAIATGEDRRVPGAEGDPPSRAADLLHLYMQRVLRLGTFDTYARQVVLDVIGLLKPPAALFEPRLVYLALRKGGPRPTTAIGPAPRLAVAH